MYLFRFRAARAAKKERTWRKGKQIRKIFDGSRYKKTQEDMDEYIWRSKKVGSAEKKENILLAEEKKNDERNAKNC